MVVSTEIASVVSKFFDGGKGPSHDELTVFFKQVGLGQADPGMTGPEGNIGKMKRVRRVLTYAADENPDAGAKLVVKLVDAVRAEGGFRPDAEKYVGKDAFEAARQAFGDLGYELDPEGHLRPATLENLKGRELTDALWAYVRRARTGATDSALVVGTAKDLSEAVARHVLVQKTGDYNKSMDFPGTLYQAFDVLGLRPPAPEMLDRLDSDGRIAVHQAAYLLSCAVNRLRNQEGSGHGRPGPSALDELDARLAAQASGLVGDLMLTTLEHRP